MKTLYSGLQILLYLLLTLPLASHAQRNIPKVTCIYCGGTGRAGYASCLFCGGSGLMADPQYQNQKAYEYGKALGLGVNVNHELAKECYSLGSQYGSINAKQAIERINQNGFWPATDQTRQNFRNALKMQIEIQGNAAMMNRNFNNSNQSNSTKDYGACPNCHGTGRCTMCAGRGEWKDNNGIYHDCSICHGGGQCPSCHGSGKLR